MIIKQLNIGFCDSCTYLRQTGNHSYCENANEKIEQMGKCILIPAWCPLPDAPLSAPSSRPDKSGG